MDGISTVEIGQIMAVKNETFPEVVICQNHQHLGYICIPYFVVFAPFPHFGI